MKLGITAIVAAAIFICPLYDKSGQDARACGQRARYEMNAGRLREALALYRKALQQADASGVDDLRLRYLNNIAACELRLFRFKDAQKTLIEARRIGFETNNIEMIAAVDGNLATLSLQTSDFSTAEMYARESVDVYSKAFMPEQRMRALTILADVLSLRGVTQEAETNYRTAIATGWKVRDYPALFVAALHYGRALLEVGRLKDADEALGQSFRAFKSSPPGTSGADALWWNQARLWLQEGRYEDALTAINRAFASARQPGMHSPWWKLLQTRAEIYQASGKWNEALADAREALKWARLMRADILPDNDNRVGNEGALDRTVAVLIDAGNRVHSKTHDPRLVRETFEVMEANRAESLQSMMASSGQLRTRLATPEYRQTLASLMVQQRMLVAEEPAAGREKVEKLQAALLRMEGDAGVTAPPQTGAILDRVQRNLPADAALLSFRLGDHASWLWSYYKGRLSVYRLASKPVMLADIGDFQKAILANDTRNIRKLGQRLYLQLFGRGRAYEDAARWFISVDQSLYTLPIPALVVNDGKRGPTYLTQRMPLQLLPGAQLFRAPGRVHFAQSRFVLAGDGVYNRADPRFDKGSVLQPASWGMARLPGTGAEVKAASHLWRRAALLTGSRLTKPALLSEIDQDPDVIHIATHVLETKDRWRSGMLALGLDAGGQPDLLTAREIEMHPVHSRLVVMSGCSSAEGEALPASGLMGLTRAWLAAGAGTVVATRWPARDENADGLITSFYHHLLFSQEGNIPDAIRRACEDMIARGGWHAEPRYWSSYFLIGIQ